MTRAWRASVVLAGVLLIAAASRAADPKLVVLPTEGKLVGAVLAPEPGKWVVISAKDFLPVQPKVFDGGKLVVFEGAAGAYAVIFFPPGETAQPVVERVTLGGVGPNPDPGPDPDPDPNPEPTPNPTDKLFVVIVRETETQTPTQGQIYASAAIREWLASKSAKMRIVDPDEVDATGKPPSSLVAYVERAKTKTLPFLFIVSGQGKLIYEGKLPADEQATLALLKSKGGA